MRKIFGYAVMLLLIAAMCLLFAGCGDEQDSVEDSVPVQSEELAEQEPEGASCTIAIFCDTLLDSMDMLDEEKHEMVPEDGVILPVTTVSFSEGEDVFTLLQRICRENKIHLEFSEDPIYSSAYVEGLNNLYEFDAGELSGWYYSANGWFPNYGSSRYVLKDGDVIEWHYSCELGYDIEGYTDEYAEENGIS